MKSLFAFLERPLKGIIASGVRERHDSEAKRRIFFVNILALVGVIFLVTLGMLAFYQHATVLGAADFVGALFFFLVALYLHYTGNEPVSARIFAYGANLLFCLLFYTGGVKSTAFMWLYTYPTLSFFLLGPARGLASSLFLFLFTICFLMYDLSVTTVNVYTFDFAIRFIPSFLVVLFFSFLLEFHRKKATASMVDKQTSLAHLVKKLIKKEKQLEEARNHLEQRVADRTEELLATNEKLVKEINERKKTEEERKRLEAELSSAQKMELLGRLAGGVAHDLNNVLTGIVGYPDLLLMDLPEDSHLRSPLVNIKKSGEKAAAIVQDLLTLARRGVMHKKQVSLNDVVTEYLNSPEYSRLHDNHHDVVVEQQLADHLPEIEGSALHLQKAFMNLVMNAYEALEGPGTVTIVTEIIRFDKEHNGYECIEKGEYAVVSVKDSGSGMPAKVVQKIFEPFYTRKQMGRSGTGLGMTVVWGTVKDHDGYVDIISVPGHGTAISLYFPLHSSLVSPFRDKALSLTAMHHGAGQRILIVDDVEEQRILGSTLLKKLGYQVWVVSSGEDAVAFVRDQSVDLVILDMIMPPGMDGLDTYKQICALYPDQKGIIISGYSENDRVTEAMQLGIGAYLKKPYTVEEISSVMHDVLSG